MLRRAIAISALVASCGCASKGAAPTAAPQPTFTQRLLGSLPHPGDRVASRPKSDDYEYDDKRDKDNDF